MFADPQSVTVDTVAKTLPRVSSTGNSSAYREATGEHQLTISSTFNKRYRSMVRLDHAKIAEDPITAVNTEVGAGIYLVMDRPKFGYTTDEITSLAAALTAWCTEANLARVLGGES